MPRITADSMPDTWLLRASSAVIRVLASLAPAWRRDEWRDEWLGELHFRTSRLAAYRRLTAGAQLRLWLRCCGAFVHLLWMWQHEWSLDMLMQDVRYASGFLVPRVSAALLFDVRPWDPLTFAGATLAIALAGFVASWLPARRACRVDPAAALRSE